MSDYRTTCPKCDSEDRLRVISFHACTSIPLCSDGFDTSEGSYFATSEEKVQCGDCEATMPLTDLMTG